MSLWKKIEWRIRLYYKKIKNNTTFQKLNNNNKTLYLANCVNGYLKSYKKIYTGKDIYIIGCGPTEKQFDPKNRDGIFIGVNRAFKDERICFDYLFAQDVFPEGMDEFADYKPDTCTKMLAWVTGNEDIRIRQTEAFKMNCNRYILDWVQMGKFPYDISIEPFADYRGTVFSALQFALYTNPKRIFLVGFDCSDGDIFSKKKENFSYQYKSWLKIKEYVNREWSNTEIISVNPVGLKGLFVDQFTD